ncbi:KUP/HAK/KT family potassium transporter [Kitasatospora sp. NPDC093679]|uniref:KUP/HAK/KT family potassium transporter n=1 Tax=Kitasatospora sp. NPDC093679 TaxID=3154983 RepID=UPI003427D731
MRANVEHNHVRHDQVVILSVRTETVPRVPADRRIVVDDLGYAEDGIIHVTARVGYMETPDVPGTPALLEPADTEGELQLDQATYFLSKIELRRGKEPTMAPWRKRLFVATSYITARRRRVLRPPARPHRHHGLPHRGGATAGRRAGENLRRPGAASRGPAAGARFRPDSAPVRASDCGRGAWRRPSRSST